MASTAYSDFLLQCSNSSNCKIICQNNQTISTHKIIIAICGDFLKSLIQEIPIADEATIFLPDYTKQDVELLIENRLLKIHSTSASLNQDDIFSFTPQKKISSELITKIKVEEEKKKVLLPKTDDYDDGANEDADEDDDDDDDVDELSHKTRKYKSSTSISRKSEYKPRNVDFEKLSQKLIGNPQTREDFKHNEIIEKQILHEKAIEAYLR